MDLSDNYIICLKGESGLVLTCFFLDLAPQMYTVGLCIGHCIILIIIYDIRSTALLLLINMLVNNINK